MILWFLTLRLGVWFILVKHIFYILPQSGEKFFKTALVIDNVTLSNPGI